MNGCFLEDSLRDRYYLQSLFVIYKKLHTDKIHHEKTKKPKKNISEYYHGLFLSNISVVTDTIASNSLNFC